MTDSQDRSHDGDFVQSLERGLSVIRAFDAEHPKLTLSEVAASTGLSRAAARRFLVPRAVPIVVGLFALADWLIYYSSEIKQYSCDLALTLVALLLAAGPVPAQPSKRRLLAIGVVQDKRRALGDAGLKRHTLQRASMVNVCRTADCFEVVAK